VLTQRAARLTGAGVLPCEKTPNYRLWNWVFPNMMSHDFASCGALFPASDDTYRDASSLALLRHVVARVAGAGWSIVNVDVVVNAEEPQLAPHLDAMTTTVRDALGGAHVSITPKRGEGIGAVGRHEGIQCWAVALLESGESPRD